MIGYAAGGPGGEIGPDVDAIRDAWNDTVDYVRDRVSDILTPVVEFVEEVAGAWLWVLDKVAIVYPVIFERWTTAADERVCPECGPIDGAVWEEGSGPHPPVHVNCRCRRTVA